VCVWKLKEEKTCEEYRCMVGDKVEEANWKGLCVNDHWQQMKGIIMETAQDICGMTKGPRRHKETWWWNEDVAEAVREKKVKYRKWKRENTEEARLEYKKSRQNANRVISSAKEKKQKEWANDLNDSEYQNEIFRMAKHMVRERQDITGLNCIKGASGKVIVDDKGIKNLWKEYMEKLMNEENEWDHKISAEVKEGPADCIRMAEVRAVMKKMKRHNAEGLSGLVTEMIQATGDIGIQWILDLCNGILKEGSIPGDWKSSEVLPVYKGKGDPMECGSYKGIKLLKHAMKVVERIFEYRIRQQIEIEIDDM